MRILLILCACLVLWNCEDKESHKKNTSSVKDSIPEMVKKTVKIEDTLVEPKRKYPKLNDKSAMEFFLKYNEEHKENKVRITTDFGSIDILLFNETKFHRANFIFLTKIGYFNGTQFHRVVKDFIIQGGNSDDQEIADRRNRIGKYLLPPDTKHGFHHSRGMVSMPSSEIENAYKLASPYEFFIVVKNSFHLDGDYTIFGKVIDGMDVVDKISEQPTDDGEWPLNNVYIKKVEIIK